LPPINVYEPLVAKLFAAVDPLVPTAPVALEPVPEFISMNAPGVTALEAEPAVPGAPLPTRQPVTVTGCVCPAVAGCWAIDWPRGD
jgi:hypothetical protein